MLSDQSSIALTFNTDGSIATVNGGDPKSQNVTLNWGTSGTTSQTFDLTKVFNRNDFTQSMNVTDNSGNTHILNLNYTKVNDANNQWRINVVDQGSGATYATINAGFDSNGKLTGVGTLDPNTGIIAQADGQRNATSQSVAINWGAATGGLSNLNFDFSSLNSNGGTSLEVKKTQTDSVALGKRTAVNISQDGVVSATYANASGSGSTIVNLYRLAINNFSGANSLTPYAGTKYLQTNDNTGADTILPSGSQINLGGNLVFDSNGKQVSAFGGSLIGTPKTTSTITALQTIDNKYVQDIYQEALGQENPVLRYAQYFKDNISSLTNIYQVLSDRALANVVQTVGQLPSQIYSQPIETQATKFGQAIDLKKVKNQSYVNDYINNFVAISDANGAGNGGSNGWQAYLLDNTSATPGDNTTPMDFSGLNSAVGSLFSGNA